MFYSLLLEIYDIARFTFYLLLAMLLPHCLTAQTARKQ